MGKYREKENPVINYKSGDLFSFQLTIEDYIRKNPELSEINLENEPIKIIEDIFSFIGDRQLDFSVTNWAKVAEANGITRIDDSEAFTLEVEWLDTVDVLALESFLAYLRRTGFDIGDYDGEEWDTPGYDSYE